MVHVTKSYIFTVCYRIFLCFWCKTCAFVPTGTPRELTGTPGAYVLHNSQPLLRETHYYLLISRQKPFDSDDHGHISCSFCQITKKLFALNFAQCVTPWLCNLHNQPCNSLRILALRLIVLIILLCTNLQLHAGERQSKWEYTGSQAQWKESGQCPAAWITNYGNRRRGGEKEKMRIVLQHKGKLVSRGPSPSYKS